MSTETLTALTALGGVLLGGAVSYRTALRVADRSAANAQRVVEAEHRRSMHTSRLERMRASYAVLLRATRTLEAQARAAESSDFGVLWDHETIDRDVNEAMARVRDVEATLLLESDGPEMLDTFRAFNAAYNGYRPALAQANMGNRSEFTTRQAAFNDAIAAVIAKAQADVRAVELE